MISELKVEGFGANDVPFYAQDDRHHETMIDRKSVQYWSSDYNGGGSTTIKAKRDTICNHWPWWVSQEVDREQKGEEMGGGIMWAV